MPAVSFRPIFIHTQSFSRIEESREATEDRTAAAGEGGHRGDRKSIRVASRNILSSCIHPSASATVLHPYSAIAEKTSGKNGCFDGGARGEEANVARSRYAPQSAPRMIYIPFRDPFGMPSASSLFLFFLFFYPSPLAPSRVLPGFLQRARSRPEDFFFFANVAQRRRLFSFNIARILIHVIVLFFFHRVVVRQTSNREIEIAVTRWIYGRKYLSRRDSKATLTRLFEICRVRDRYSVLYR